MKSLETSAADIVQRMSNPTKEPNMILPYPSITKIITVMRDIPGCDGLRWWEIASKHKDAIVARYEMPTDSDGDVDYSQRQWDLVASDLVKKHPGCVFIY